jgi:hypothetical protein
MSKYRGVSGGTPFGPPLCRTCRNAHYRKGNAEGEFRLLCSGASYDSPEELKWEAIECSDYDDKRQSELGDMKKVAWLLRTDPTKRILGFASPQQMSEAERYAVSSGKPVTTQKEYE